MATYLVTGAAGFIGSKVCELLLVAGHRIVGIDNLNDYYDVRLKDYRLGSLLGGQCRGEAGSARVSYFRAGHQYSHGAFSFSVMDVEDLAALDSLFREYAFEAVFNLAARAGVRASMANPYAFLATNTEGTLNILECQRKFGVKKQILASTSSLYSGCPMPFTEDQPVNTPLSPYAAAKKAAELMAYSYHKLYGLDITVLRYFTVFGPAGRPDMAPFRFIKSIDEGRPITIFGDGNQSRDFTYVDDIAAGTILGRREVGYEIVNLGGGRNPISLHALIELMEAGLQKKAIVERRPFVDADMKETWADIEKAHRLLGWTPRISVEEGIRRTIRWHRANQDWVQKIAL